MQASSPIGPPTESTWSNSSFNNRARLLRCAAAAAGQTIAELLVSQLPTPRRKLKSLDTKLNSWHSCASDAITLLSVHMHGY